MCVCVAEPCQSFRPGERSWKESKWEGITRFGILRRSPPSCCACFATRALAALFNAAAKHTHPKCNTVICISQSRLHGLDWPRPRSPRSTQARRLGSRRGAIHDRPMRLSSSLSRWLRLQPEKGAEAAAERPCRGLPGSAATRRAPRHPAELRGAHWDGSRRGTGPVN